MPTYFTRAEADALLPRLTPMLRALQALRVRGVALHDQVMSEQGKVQGNGHRHPQEAAELRRETRLLEEQVAERLRDLDALGVLLKDMATGLVDFPTLRAGREVYLCWRLGEPRVAWWHEIEAGIAGRQPLEDG
jgi:hypothetical protein